MKNIKVIRGVMLIVSLMTVSSLANAARPGTPGMPLEMSNVKLPAHYPAHALPAGKITRVLKQKRVIVIDGAAFKLHPVHDIYTRKKGQKATLYNLKKGMKVGLGFTTHKGMKVVNKIWILPKKYPTTKFTH